MIRIVFAFICLSFSSPPSRKEHGLARDREGAARALEKTYSTEKILKISKKGNLEYYATERQTQTTDYWGWLWETKVIERNGAFARQVADVTVERANKTQASFEVAALFERMGNAWQSKGVAVRGSKDLSAAKAGDLPSNAQAAAIFSEAWKKHRPDFAVEKSKC